MAGKEPKLPQALEEELTRLAQEILFERSADARRVAALEMGSKLLRRAIDLFQIGGLGTSSTATSQRRGTNSVHNSAPAPVVLNPCKWCGKPGTLQPKPSKFDPKPGWLCKEHAIYEQADAANDSLGSKIRFEPVE